MKIRMKKYRAFYSYDAILGNGMISTPIHGKFESENFFELSKQIETLLFNITGTCTIVFQNNGDKINIPNSECIDTSSIFSNKNWGKNLLKTKKYREEMDKIENLKRKDILLDKNIRFLKDLLKKDDKKWKKKT